MGFTCNTNRGLKIRLIDNSENRYCLIYVYVRGWVGNIKTGLKDVTASVPFIWLRIMAGLCEHGNGTSVIHKRGRI
jgi:hypothetical protein